MCGIIGAHDPRTDITHRLLEGLEALEYRGYDSAGVAVLTVDGLQLHGRARVQLLKRTYR